MKLVVDRVHVFLKEAAVWFGLPAESDGLISYGTVTMTSSMYQPEDTWLL